MPVRLLWEHVVLPQRVGRAFQPDMVLAPFNVAPTGWPSPAPRLAVIVSNLAPYSSDVRRMYRGRELLRLEALRRLTDRTLAAAAHIFLLSRQALSLIDERLLDGKAEVIPMAPPARPPIGHVAARAIPADPFFVVVADLLRYKGVELVLEALARLPRKARPGVVIAGRPLDRPYVRSLRRSVRALRLEDRVTFAGLVEHEEVLALMRASVACIVSSRLENPSRVPVEAMSLEVPIIASDIPAFREVCGAAALYFDLDDPDGLADRMRQSTDDPSFRERWGQRGSERLVSLDTGSASERILRSLEALAPG